MPKRIYFVTCELTTKIKNKWHSAEENALFKLYYCKNVTKRTVYTIESEIVGTNELKLHLKRTAYVVNWYLKVITKKNYYRLCIHFVKYLVVFISLMPMKIFEIQ